MVITFNENFNKNFYKNYSRSMKKINFVGE